MVPNRFRTKLRVSSFGNVTITGTASDIQLYATGRPFRALFGTLLANIEPQGFDQWTAFYENYRVLGMKYNFRLARISSETAGGLIRITDHWSTDTSQPGIAQRYNDRFTKVRNLGISMSGVSYKKYVRPWKILGMSYKQWYYSPDTFSNTGPPAGVPARLPYGYITFSSPGNISTVVEYTLIMDMYIEFFDTKTVVDI